MNSTRLKEMSDLHDLLPGGMGPVEDEPPRRTLSDEHKAKMAEGRRRSRGRPANRTHPVPMPAARSAETQTDQGIEPENIDYEALAGTLTRQTNANANNMFDIPMKGRIPGWDYCYWPYKINGEDVDAGELNNYSAGGWMPVEARHFPQLCPPGWNKRTIERGGQRMYMRPMRLTEEALAEQDAQAFERRQAALARAAAGESGSQYAPRRNDGLNVQIKPLLE
jgi:hypothetical protein